MCYGYFWGGGMWLFPLLMFVIVVAAIYLIFGRGRFAPPWYDNDRNYRRDDSSDKALDILKQRYARGEINKEEFEEKKRTLQN